MLRGRSKEYLKGTRRHGKFRFEETRFLFSRLGHPWEEIHSELSAEFDRRTYAGYRFWRNFEGRYGKTVATNCWIGSETGNIYDPEMVYRWNHKNQVVQGFYVHPFTRILCYNNPKKFDYTVKPPVERPIYRIKVDDFNGYEKIEGIWYRIKYELNHYYSAIPSLYPTIYGNEKYLMIYPSKRQLSTKELMHMTLKNDPPGTWQEETCDVCFYIEGIKKKTRCFYCKECKAWICNADKDNWVRRVQAASIKLTRKLTQETGG